MKKYIYFVLCGLVGSALFTSCNKDDDEVTPELKSQRILYNPDGSIELKEIYTYDEKGRVTSYEAYEGDKLYMKDYDFNYEGTTATFNRVDGNEVYTCKKVFRNENCIYDEFITNQYFNNGTEVFNETYTFNDNGLVAKYSRSSEDILEEERVYTYEGNKVFYTKNSYLWDDFAEVTDYTLEYADANYKQLNKISVVLDPNTENPEPKEYLYSYDNQGRINNIKYYYEGELYEEKKDFSYDGLKVTYKDCLVDNGEVYYEYTCEEYNWDENSNSSIVLSSYTK